MNAVLVLTVAAVGHAPVASVPWAVVVVFAIAGALHFVVPRAYEQIMPRWVPANGPMGRRALVLASGGFEVLGALGVWYAPTRAAAGWGLVLLLAAVLPANVEMLAAARRAHASRTALSLLIARLPLQPLMMWWVWASTVRAAAGQG